MSTGTPDYKWDVFFSYRRAKETRAWMDNFAKRISYWISTDLGRPAQIFIDESSIELGELWSETLKEAVQSSRCMVGILSPLYFESHWCRWELGSFWARGEKFHGDGSALIAPVRFHDGDGFPHQIKDVAMYDVREYALSSEAFWSSAKAVDLEVIIKSISGRLVDLIGRSQGIAEGLPIEQFDGLKTTPSGFLVPTDRRLIDLRFVVPVPAPKIVEVRSAIKQCNAEYLRWLSQHPEDLYNIHPATFEDIMAEIFRHQGFEVEKISSWNQGDGGVDLLAIRKLTGQADVRLAVQCKRYDKNRKVSAEVVRALAGVLDKFHAHQGVVATTSTFAKSAREEVGSTFWRVSLQDHDNIVGALKSFGVIGI
jgi:hypothetical protein